MRSEEFPRHSYSFCNRRHPAFKGTVGASTLTISRSQIICNVLQDAIMLVIEYLGLLHVRGIGVALSHFVFAGRRP